MKITDDMLTEWFPADEYAPVHEGEYETRTTLYPVPEQRLFANGHWWKFLSGIGKCESAFISFIGAEFRGLKEKYHG
ncbi:MULTISPECIES: hypothetical protein [unclassified Burkholderia]|uniref:hypothetical protein n=1 Tax=unclassified Burkholderia TaxID=2613784 RepID=UPI000B258A29|nr:MULTISPECIES: hypothetical protein [unclassified Burkholderia]